jgi:hypothetical protein
MSQTDTGRPVAPRPFLQVLFDCCNVYQRVYRDPSGAFYLGRCPRCLRSIRFTVGKDGTTSRTFVVG